MAVQFRAREEINVIYEGVRGRILLTLLPAMHLPVVSWKMTQRCKNNSIVPVKACVCSRPTAGKYGILLPTTTTITTTTVVELYYDTTAVHEVPTIFS